MAVFIFALIFAVLALPVWAGVPAGPLSKVYRLHVYLLHANECIDIVYRVANTYIAAATHRLEVFLRDHRTRDAHLLDPHLFDVLHDLTVALERPSSKIGIVCGYPTPWSNEFLHPITSAVADHSLHMEGEAIDIRMSG